MWASCVLLVKQPVESVVITGSTLPFSCERVRIKIDEEAWCAWKEMPNLSLFYYFVMPTIKYG